MEQLTAEGLRVVTDLAQRYGFSQEAVIHMMFALLKGRGRMAQFNHPEFAGSGQWMAGGMMMLGDMFNHALKARVDGLCQAMAGLLASQPELFPSGSFQSQSQSGGGQQMQVGTGLGQQMQFGAGSQQQQTTRDIPPPSFQPAGMPPMGSGRGSLFVSDPRDTWWPAELGTPSATGAQNDVRYAYFPASGRLAVEVNGRVGVYDAGDHRIAGFSQQQGSGGAVVFSTPGGAVSLSTLSPVGSVSQQAQTTGGGSQQQQSSSGGQQMQFSGGGMPPMSGMAAMGGMAPMRPMAPLDFAFESQGPWWPAELGTPAATGAQNELRYATFPGSARLAVNVNGVVSVHDTDAHRVTGVSREESSGEVMVSTAEGTLPLVSLPKLPIGSGMAAEAVGATGKAGEEARPAGAEPHPAPGTDEVLSALERLAGLREKGILSEEEFTAKKAELLSRL